MMKDINHGSYGSVVMLTVRTLLLVHNDGDVDDDDAMMVMKALVLTSNSNGNVDDDDDDCDGNEGACGGNDSDGENVGNDQMTKHN
jgi:hypothetical protein